MSTKIKIIFHSLYGHSYKMAQAIADGASIVNDVEAELLRIPETLSEDILKKMGADDSIKEFSHIDEATADALADADGLIFGCGTRFGSASSQMQAFLDTTGSLWQNRKLVGKAGGVFVSTGTQHGGQETTLISMQTFLMHQGMVVVGVPYAAKGLSYLYDISGGTPYGASTISGSDGSRQPSENELEVARFQGKHTAQIAAKLKA